jgi:hypothetical protein
MEEPDERRTQRDRGDAGRCIAKHRLSSVREDEPC